MVEGTGDVHRKHQGYQKATKHMNWETVSPDNAAGPNGPQLTELTDTFAGQEVIDRTLVNA